MARIEAPRIVVASPMVNLSFRVFAFLAVKLGGVGIYEQGHYQLKARFLNTSGLKEDAPVEVAGVIVGRVESIEIDAIEYAQMELDLRKQAIEITAFADLRKQYKEESIWKARCLRKNVELFISNMER